MKPQTKNQPMLKLLPNRARRNYAGGRILDEMQKLPHPADGIMPEDWLASTTPASTVASPA